MTKSLKEHLYLWCHNPGVYNQGIRNLNETSFMTPVEAAAYMDIDNILMVSYAGKPTPPFAPIQEHYAHFKRVVWSVIGDAACKYDNDEAYVDEIIGLHKHYTNVTGGIMDDFFAPGRAFNLEAIARKMREAELPLWVVVYENQLSDPVVLSKLSFCDVITFWIWSIRDIAVMEDRLCMLRRRFPDKKLVSGLYLWNFGDALPLTVHHMSYQCNVALDYLRAGIIDDIIVLGSPLIGMNLPTVEWTRQWINENA